jgi:hypothetical protein
LESSLPRVLVINPNYEDYLADGVFHGLRTLLGADAVDFPKAEYLYESAPQATLARLRGGGFTLYGLLPELPIERDHVWLRALDGEFDLVVFADIRGTFGQWVEWGPQLARAGIRIAVLDGADRAGPYPFAGRWWRYPGLWFLPRAHNRAAYFKREITPRTRWCASYLLLPPPLGRSLGIRPISFCIPAEKITGGIPDKDKEFPAHVVDPELAAKLGASTDYAFTTELEYYDDLRRSKYGITTKRAGWDALRHYEIAANGAVPCFRDLDRKPASCAPRGLDRSNSVGYESADDLLAQLARIDDPAYSRLQAGALEWVRANTTIVRARELLAACEVG